MKNIKVCILAAILCSCLFSVTARTVSAHPIDTALKEKMDADSTTSGMIEACQWAVQEWDKLLNENYKTLMTKLDKENQELLRASQLAWIKYRDLEFKFNYNFWGGFDGTMYRPFPSIFQANFVRERALELGSYLKDLKDK